MTYTFRETDKDVIVERGIATREMTLEYEHGKEYASYEELARAARRTPVVPIVLDRDGHHNIHGLPLRHGKHVVGTAHLKPCPEKRGLAAEWRFHKESCPEWVIQAVRRGETLPVSVFKFANIEEGQQRDILFDHVAILQESTPRCPPERCGVGVADALTEKPKEEEKPEEPVEKPATKTKRSITLPEGGTPVPQPVPGEPGGKLSKAAPSTEAEQTVETPPTDTEVAELRERLKEAQAQVTAVRAPLVQQLESRGYTPEELQFIKTETLTKMVRSARQADTQALPATAPQPPPKPPKTLAEARTEVYAKAEAENKAAMKQKWGDLPMFDE